MKGGGVFGGEGFLERDTVDTVDGSVCKRMQCAQNL